MILVFLNIIQENMSFTDRLVSILIPVYNVERYLEECLDTIINQTYKNLEIILANDGSDDSSGKICDAYAARDSRIRVIHKKNQGLLMTRRLLFREAKGEYLLCVDSDDWIEKTAVEKAMSLVEAYGADLVIFGYDARKKSEEKPRKRYLYTTENMVFQGEGLKKVYRDIAWTGNLNYIWQKLIARKLILPEDDRNPVYQTLQLGEDIVQLLPIVSRAKVIASCNQYLYHYRLSDTGMSRNFKMDYLKDKLTILNEKEQFLYDNEICTEQDMKTLYTRTYLEVIQSVYSMVHCQKYGVEEIKNGMKMLNQESTFLKLRNQSSIQSWRKMDRLVEGLLCKKYYGILIAFLKTEHALVHLIRK